LIIFCSQSEETTKLQNSTTGCCCLSRTKAGDGDDDAVDKLCSQSSQNADY